MEKLFYLMSGSKNIREFLFLCPWKLLVGGINDPFGGDAAPGTGHWRAATCIAETLERTYGVNHSAELYRQYTARTRWSVLLSEGRGIVILPTDVS